MMRINEEHDDCYPAKGRYVPGEPVTLILETMMAEADTAKVSCLRLENEIFSAAYAIRERVTEIVLPAFEGELLGLGIQVILLKDGAPKKTLYTAADVSVKGSIVRYGFLSGFGEEDMEDRDIAAMAKYHINAVQFYDWSYRHDHLVAPTDAYNDMMGKRNSLPCVKYKIGACRKHGMEAMAYGAVYAASRQFWEEHRDWGLYALSGKPLVFIDTFYYMNIARECPWRGHIIGQYIKAMEVAGFDGIHMDAYGYPKAALDAAGRVCDLQNQLPELISDTEEHIRNAGKKPFLIFNNVGAWPVEDTMQTRQNAVYMEVWPPYERLFHLKELILKARPAGKPVVLAAYLAPFRLDTEERALYCALITSFAIAMNGATQLFLGEENAVLTQGYYADHAHLAMWQAERIRAYQDFFVRYEELLFDPALQDVTMTHCCGDNMEYRCDTPFSAYGEPDKLWLTLRESAATKMIVLLNLKGNQEDYWNRGKEKPAALSTITFHIQVLRPITSVWYATPDEMGGAPIPLPFSIVETDRGLILTVTVPHLEISGLLWFHEQ